MYYFSKVTGAGLFCWHGRFVSENTTDWGEMQARPCDSSPARKKLRREPIKILVEAAGNPLTLPVGRLY
jgi:hypothetical protein